MAPDEWDYDVDNWLPSYGSSGIISRLNFIVEACQCGNFINQLADDGRIITSSTAQNIDAAPMTGTDYPSFSFNVFKKMTDGETSLGDAFNDVCPFVEEDDYLPANINPMNPNVYQDPKLDDWGDSNKQGSDHILPNGNDGIYALKTGL